MRPARLSICGLHLVVSARSREHRLLGRVAASIASRDLDGAISEMDRAWRTGAIDHRALAPIYARLLVRQGRNWGAVIGLLSAGLRGLETRDSQADLALAFEKSGQPEMAAQVREAARALATSLDGRATIRAGAICGWVRLPSRPDRAVDLEVRTERGEHVRVRADQPLPAGCWGFRFQPRPLGLTGDRFEILAKLPDRSLRLLPDAPLLTARLARTRLEELTPRQRTQPSREKPPVSIVIPAYRDCERTLACINAVRNTTRGQIASLIVIDDASPEPDLSAGLDALAANGDITLLRNASNLGFSASVNRAVATAGENDVVLVNSDVMVFGDWLSRLRRAAYAVPRTGTATPLADDDSIAGYFGIKDGEDPVARADKLDRIAAKELSGHTIDLPVGVGFCMYIRRDCWLDTGAFDEVTFPAGYGEEADFCMRARSRRWRHVLAADVFVHHAGGKSFGARRDALLERSWRLLNLRHPTYRDQVRRFLTPNPLRFVHRKLEAPQLLDAAANFRIIMTLSRGGGVERFVKERCREIRSRGGVPLILQAGADDDPRWCALVCPDRGVTDLRYQIPGELQELRALLDHLQIDSIEFHHFLGLDPRVIELVQGLGAPIDTYIHDYSWICPRVTLIDGTGSYCGEPAVTVCEQCIRRNGSNLPETISVRALRQRSRRWLQASRRVIAPTRDTTERLQRYFPELRVEAVPHETFVHAGAVVRQISSGPTVRVAIVGAIGHHKGYRILLDCARDAARRKLALEFVIIGYSEDDARLMKTGKVWITGRYREAEIQRLLAREGADVVFLPSVWPETWCYTLSHAIASGLPVVAFDIGAMGERLRAESRGTLLPVGLPPRKINDLLVQIGRASARSDTMIFGSNS